MADDISELFSPGAVTKVGQGLPRRDERQPARQRRAPQRAKAASPLDDDIASPPGDEPRLIGSHLDVRA